MTGLIDVLFLSKHGKDLDGIAAAFNLKRRHFLFIKESDKMFQKRIFKCIHKIVRNMPVKYVQ